MVIIIELNRAFAVIISTVLKLPMGKTRKDEPHRSTGVGVLKPHPDQHFPHAFLVAFDVSWGMVRPRLPNFARSGLDKKLKQPQVIPSGCIGFWVYHTFMNIRKSSTHVCSPWQELSQSAVRLLSAWWSCSCCQCWLNIETYGGSLPDHWWY